ncbi:NUDIX hydrolase [Flavilitoribacter nigricans]|nr:NUDIX hydrolase [Flavilitoribacter nigricans]
MWKKLSERIAYKGWRQIKVKQFELPDGKIAEFDILSSRSFVTVAAFTTGGELILIRQYRPGPERELLSFCEGAIDPGETPVQSAHRELLEETGYATEELIFLKKRYSAYTDQEQFFFLALNCRYQQAPEPDAGEFLSVELSPESHFRAMLRDADNDLFNNIDAAYLALDFISGRTTPPSKP